MPIDWGPYDRFDWAGATQSPMSEGRRDCVAEFAAEVLELSAADRGTGWGAASPPGRYAATVIRVSPGLDHRYRSDMRAAGVGEVGVKVFKTTGDARREAAKVVPFHRDSLRRLPGLPNDRVQRSLDAGFRRDRDGRERGFVAQEWVTGDTLEELIRRSEEPLGAAAARSIVVQLLGDIVIPLWAAGTVWWDFRDANYCYDGVTGTLQLIDVDSLAAYAGEILDTPEVWAKRDKGRATATARLRKMAVRVVQARGVTTKRKAEAAVTEIWDAELGGPLASLGRGAVSREEAEVALNRFLGGMFDRGLFSE